MPITPSISTKRIEQEEFKHMAYEVMEHVFAIHNEFGRFFDERIYKAELANRMEGVALEVGVDVTHQTFSKRYWADAIVSDSGLLEFKATEAIHDRHVGQTVNYLLLFNLAHAKIINVRPEKVESKFVNCHQRLSDLRNPQVVDSEFDATVPGAERFREVLCGLIKDWGAGLQLSLYADALTHFFGGEETVVGETNVKNSSDTIGTQKMRFIEPDVAFHLFALPDITNHAIHTRRLLEHTDLRAIHWANLTTSKITFTTIKN